MARGRPPSNPETSFPVSPPYLSGNQTSSSLFSLPVPHPPPEIYPFLKDIIASNLRRNYEYREKLNSDYAVSEEEVTRLRDQVRLLENKSRKAREKSERLSREETEQRQKILELERKNPGDDMEDVEPTQTDNTELHVSKRAKWIRQDSAEIICSDSKEEGEINDDDVSATHSWPKSSPSNARTDQRIPDIIDLPPLDNELKSSQAQTKEIGRKKNNPPPAAPKLTPTTPEAQPQSLLGSELKRKKLSKIKSEMDKLNATKSKMVWLLKQVITAENKRKVQLRKKQNVESDDKNG